MRTNLILNYYPYFLYSIFLSIALFSSCQNKEGKGTVWESEGYRELTPAQNPDDPDVHICDSTYYGKFSHLKVEFIQEDDNLDKFTIKFIPNPNNSFSDTIVIPNVSLDEWIPTVPEYLRHDPDGHLAQIAIFNQQFNRIQAKFEKSKREFFFDSKNKESEIMTRIDIAKNCLNMPLWEVIGFSRLPADKSGKRDAPVYHGWFNFPYDLHTKLMKKQGWSNEKALEYTDKLSSWNKSVPRQKPVDLKDLRTVEVEYQLPLLVKNDTLYPIQKYDERWKKYRNIIYPRTEKISDFLTDATCFAKFINPGIYSKVDTMRTQLGRFKFPDFECHLRKTESTNKQKNRTLEFEIQFLRDGPGSEMTRLVVGGIDINKIDTLDEQNANKAKFQMPMGIANHPFGQSYKNLSNPANSAVSSPYFAFLLDRNNVWLNSHDLGIDGVLLHFDKSNPQMLHIWLLSFERHALVGHFIVDDDGHDWGQYKK
jgi:hypothetical protein